MTSHRQLRGGCEDAHSHVAPSVLRRQHERRFRECHLFGDGLHLGRAQASRVGQHGKLVALEGRGGEDVEVKESKLGARHARIVDHLSRKDVIACNQASTLDSTRLKARSRSSSSRARRRRRWPTSSASPKARRSGPTRARAGRSETVLRRDRLSPRDRGFHDPGRRSARHGYGRTWLLVR